MKNLKIPALKGKIGNWVYFNSTMKVKEVANPERIKTVSESNLYPKNINEVLQREIDSTRINKISEYLTSQNERFLNTIIVAIHNGNPTWGEIKIHENLQIDGEKLDDEDVSYLDGRFGVLTLRGDEKIFVLDGQHRLRGIREAFKKNPEFGEEDVSLTFVVHEDKFVERTRRLFTVLNRYAEKPKKAEIIIMDEDDSAAILTRRLILEYETFQLKNALSKTRELAMPSSDITSFTTLTCLYEITKILIDFNKIHPKQNSIKRQSDSFLEELYQDKVVLFWDSFFSIFPDVTSYIGGDNHTNVFKRNKDIGGSLLLRPEGQILIAELFKFYLNKGDSFVNHYLSTLPKIDFLISNDIWTNVFWDDKDKNMKKGQKWLKRTLFQHLLGDVIDYEKMKNELNKQYESKGSVYDEHIQPI